MRRMSRTLSRGFVNLMILLAMIGLGLFVLGKIISVSARVPAAAPVGGVASRFRRFATTGG